MWGNMIVSNDFLNKEFVIVNESGNVKISDVIVSIGIDFKKCERPSTIMYTFGGAKRPAHAFKIEHLPEVMDFYSKSQKSRKHINSQQIHAGAQLIAHAFQKGMKTGIIPSKIVISDREYYTMMDEKNEKNEKKNELLNKKRKSPSESSPLSPPTTSSSMVNPSSSSSSTSGLVPQQPKKQSLVVVSFDDVRDGRVGIPDMADSWRMSVPDTFRCTKNTSR